MSTDIKTLVKMMQGRDEEQAFIDELIMQFTNMENARAKADADAKELMDFLDATDTRSTTNNSLPFKNSTTIPKLAHIYQMMVTSYMEHMIPNRNWLDFVGNDNDAVNAEKRQVVKAYVQGKAAASNLAGTLERLVEDFVTRGYAVVHNRHVTETTTTVENRTINNYTGTVAERVSPSDFFWDVTASTLPRANKCVRTLYTMGGLKKEIRDGTFPLMSEEQFDELRSERRSVREALSDGYNGRRKYDSLCKKGYGDMLNYVNEGVVEVLRFYGTFYDEQNDELWDNYEITLIDRKIIGRKESMDNWQASQAIHVSVYEFQKDTLAPIGPLHRLVGMQYKLDKRENFREDMHDKFLSPTLKKIGDVREKGTRGGPDHTFEAEEGGDAVWMTPPAEVLQPDNTLFAIMQLMEDLSGSPKESIGQRTAGEKTKFEVQLLDRGQNKTFRNKVKKFERELLSPTLNDYLEQGRHHLDAADMVKTFSTDLGISKFVEITADDLNLNGEMVAQGATLFAEKANTLQNINAIVNSPLGQSLAPHTSQANLMRAIEMLADIEQFDIYTFGIGVQEQQKLQQLVQQATDRTDEQSLTKENVGEPESNPPQ